MSDMDVVKPPEQVWLNGRMVPWDAATTSVCAYGLNYGMGIFEGVRSYVTQAGPAAFRLDAHIDRMFASAAAYSMSLPYSRGELIDASLQVMSVAGAEQHSVYIRPICWLGVGASARDRRIETAIAAWPWGVWFDHERVRHGIRVTLSPWRKIHTTMLPSTAKGSGQYLSYMLTAGDAFKRGFDEALLLDAAGNLSEGPAENLFLVRDGRLLTNDQASSILLGITRDSVLTLAADRGIPVEIRALSLDDLFSADEAFFTGTMVEIVRIREVDGRPIGDGKGRSLIAELREAFDAVTAGRDERHRDWLQPCPRLAAVGVGAHAVSARCAP